MDSAMCLRCEVVVATVSHSQFHSYSQPTSPKFSHGFCFYFCNIFFYTFFGLCGAHAMPEKNNYIQHCSVFNHPRFCASEGITPTSSTMKMFAFGRSRWLSKSFYVHKFKFFILFSYFIQRRWRRRCSCCCSCCCRCFSCIVVVALYHSHLV